MQIENSSSDHEVEIEFREPAAYLGRVKYTPAQSLKYQDRDPRKHRAEMALIRRAFAGIPNDHRVLDVPCGGGRAALELARQGYRVLAGDLSESMRQIAMLNLSEAGCDGPVLSLDVEDLQLADRSVDAVLCFRLFHHFPSEEIRRRVVAELCRVSRRYVVISYLSVWAYTSLVRRFQSSVLGKPVSKFSTSLREVAGHFEESSFRLVQDYARMPLIHTLHLAVFERMDEGC